MKLERNIPWVPYDVWFARDGGNTVGSMLIGHFPTWITAEIDVDQPDAIAALVGHLDPAVQYTFVIDAARRDALLPFIRDAGEPRSTWRLAFVPGDRLFVPDDGVPREIRGLTPADREMLDRFPGERNPPGLTLADHVTRAEETGQKSAFYGAIVEGALVAWLQSDWCIDAIHEIGAIVTHPDGRRKGHGKALLAHVTAEEERRGIIHFYNAANDPSRRTALSVGYREIAAIESFAAHFVTPVRG